MPTPDPIVFPDDDRGPYDGLPCPDCDGEGMRMICPDDMCRGAGHCLAETPDAGCFAVCRTCKGEG